MRSEQTQEDTTAYTGPSGGNAQHTHVDDYDKEEKYDKHKDKTTAELHDQLMEIDEASGKRIHPNDRRKILR